MFTFFSFALISLFLFVIGTIVGSFVNVVVYRSVRDEDWVHGRSQCEECGKTIHWYDNIPLLSFIFLKGKCRYCKKTIGITHPVVEFLTGSLFVWWYWGGTLFFKLTDAPFQVIQPLFWLVIGIILLLIVITDLLYYLIPDSAVISLTIITLLYRVLLLSNGIMQLEDFLWSLLGVTMASGFFAGLWYLTKGKGMGFGDVKLMIPVALLVGWPHIIMTIFISFILGAVVGVGLITAGKKKFGQHLPFGPFIIASTIITLIWGDQLLQWYFGFLY